MKIVLASLNQGKVNELKAMLAGTDIDIVSQADLGIPEIEETGGTFIENAIIKARHAASAAKLPAIADDSGLCVSALSGAPGIYSARYAGANATSHDNIQKLLQEMAAIPNDHRQAFFECVLVYMSHASDPAPLVCEGRWHGVIAKAASGDRGFGYDPVFYLPKHKQTAAQLEAGIKNEISHRGQAMRALLTTLKATT